MKEPNGAQPQLTDPDFRVIDALYQPRDWELITLEDEDADRHAKTEPNRDLTDELVVEIFNDCPVTHLPYSTPEMKRQLSALADAEMAKGKKILFFQFEVDRMKKLNDDLGHDGTNQAMLRYFESIQHIFGQTFPKVPFAFYRPRAGGDKARVMLCVDEQEEEEIFQKSKQIFATKFNYHQHADQKKDTQEATTVISASFGSARQLEGQQYDSVGRMIDALEEEARDAIASEKLALIQRETFERFEELQKNGEIFVDAREEVQAILRIFIDKVANEWGTIRLSEDNLRKLLWIIFGRFARLIIVPDKLRNGKTAMGAHANGAIPTAQEMLPHPGLAAPIKELVTEVTVGPSDLTATLKKKTTNECPVTGFGFEVPETRPKIAEFIEKAQANGQHVLFFQIDLDKLNQLNVKIDMAEADLRIHEHFNKMRNYLKNIPGIDFMMFRPQAGGDEMEVAIRFDPKVFRDFRRQSLINRLDKIFNFSFSKFIYLDDEDRSHFFPITGSVGYADSEELLRTKTFESNFDLLSEMQAVSDANLKEKKLIKADMKIRTKLEKAMGKSDINEYIQEIVSEWGSTRSGVRALRTVFEHVYAKLAQLFLLPSTPNAFSRGGGGR